MYNRVFEDFRKKAADHKKKMGEWKVLVKALKKDIPVFRMGILDLYYKDKEAVTPLNEIATIDALAMLPVFIEVLKDIKADNDRKLETYCKNKTGLQLEFFSASINEKDTQDTIADHFNRIIGQEIPKLFEQFVFEELGENDNLEKVKEQLTAEVVEKKITSIINAFFDRLAVKYPGKKQLLEQHKNEITKLLRMEIFLICAIKTFTGADNAQKMDGYYEKFQFWQKYSNIKLRKPFIALVFCAQGLEITPETNEWWHEVKLYLTGFYERVLRQMPGGVVHKDSKGYYVAVDDQDNDMKSYFQGLTKYDIALYYLELVAVLKQKLKPKQDIPHLLKLPEQRVPVNLFSIRPTEDNYIPQQLRDYMREFTTKGRTCAPEDKIGLLRIFVDNNVPFTRNQVEMLIQQPDDLAGAVRKTCDEYRKWDDTWIMFPRIFSGWKRTHSSLTRELENALKQNPDPQMQLREVYKIRDKLKPDSRHLLPSLDGILMNVFNRFIETAPQATQEREKCCPTV